MQLPTATTAFATLMLLGLPVAATPEKCLPAAAPSRADVASDLVFLRNVLDKQWAYAEARKRDGVVLDALVFDAQSRLLNSEPVNVAELFERFLSGIHDGQARLIEPSARPRRTWPIAIRSSREGIVVSHGNGDIMPGDTVLAVDGVQIENVIAQASARVAASTDGARRQLAIQRITETDASNVRLSIVDGAGAHRIVEVPTVASVSTTTLSADEQIEWRVLSGAIGYLQIHSFGATAWERWPIGDIGGIHQKSATPIVTKIDRAFEELADTSALILDLRGNSQGADFIAQRVSSHLLGRSAYCEISRLDSKGAWTQPTLVLIRVSIRRYSRPLAVLIDQETMGAADTLVASLRLQRPQTVFVGRPTGGSAGVVGDITLPRTCARISFPQMRVSAPGGKPIEGLGTAPDVRVEWSKQHFSNGSDPDIAAALAVLAHP